MRIRRRRTAILDSHITDHKPIALSIQEHVYYSKHLNTRTIMCYESIKEDLKNTDYKDILSATDVNHASNVLVALLSTTIARHTKTCAISRKSRILKPWMSPGLVKCIRNRDRLHSKSKKAPNNMTLKITYVRYRNFCNNLIRKLKIAYNKTQIEKAGNDPKALWKAIREISSTQKTKNNSKDLLKLSDNPNRSINCVNTYFKDIEKHLAENICQSVRPTGNSTFLSSLDRNSPSNSLVLLEVTASEIESLILELRIDCAIGWDNIPSQVLRQNHHILAPAISHVCNLAIKSGTFPDVFKKSIIHPIYKSGDRDCMNNYRPISVLPALSKILEKILNRALKTFLAKFTIIAPNQYGFRSGISTEDAVMDLTNAVVKHIDDRNRCVCIFLDLSKAFDTVSVPILLDKLQKLGIRGLTHSIFTDYLANRRQRVKIETYLSDEESMSYGVPQGSILGPTLFQLYINDLCTMKLPYTNIFTYADDTAILVWGPNWLTVKERAEYSLSRVMNWLNKNLLTLNITKTNYIAFSLSKSTEPNKNFSIKAHTCTNNVCTCLDLSRAEQVKYLGVQIDHKLKWDKQIDLVTLRVRRLIYVFKTLRNVLPQDKLTQVYLALCESVTQYCITVWGVAAKTHLLKLERAQRAILKVMSKKPYRYPTVSLYADCKVLSVRKIFILKSVLRKHKDVPLPDPNKRSKSSVCARTTCRTTFARQQSHSISTKLYNDIHKKLNIAGLNRCEVKTKVVKWLQQLDYEKTEDLLTYLA